MIFEILEATGQLQETGAIIFVIYSIYKELRWNPYRDSGDWRAPIILGIIGISSLAKTMATKATALDVVLLITALIIAIAAGASTGRIAQFHPISDAARARFEQRNQHRRDRNRTPRPISDLEIRTGWIGALLWLLALGGRYGVEAIAEHFHPVPSESTGMGLLIVAVTEAARVLVLRRRTPSSS